MDSETELKRLHETLLELLSEFDRVCKKNNIQYFLDSGTALGAIRHGGFIPWDDDADVGMLRSEYEKFMKIAPSELSDKFVLQDRSNDPLYFKHHAKLRKKNTFFPEEQASDFKYQGIFIDIFPFDYVSSNTILRRMTFFVVRYLRSRCSIRREKKARYSSYRKFLGLLLDVFPESFFEHVYHWAVSHRNKGSFLTCYEYWVCQKKLKVFKKDWFIGSAPVCFEEKFFFVMNDWNAYLKEMYKDYMKLPPEEKRVYHCSGKILFDNN